MVCASQSVDTDPSWWDDEDWLMAFDLGYDEGGAGDDLLMSVQVAVTEQAKKLKRQWNSRLGNVECFHSIDLWNFTHGVFSEAGLDRRAREELLKDLSKIIHRHLSFGVTARISKKLYADNTTEKFRSQQGSAYTFLLGNLLLAAFSCIQRLDMRAEVNIVIEEGHKNSAQAIGLLKKWKDTPIQSWLPLKILNYGLGAKADHPILQTADMLVYSKYQHILQGDRAIYEALHHKGSSYHPEALTCNLSLIQDAQQGVQEFAERRRQEWLNKRINKSAD